MLHDVGALNQVADRGDELLAPTDIETKSQCERVFLTQFVRHPLWRVRAADGIGFHFGDKFLVIFELRGNFSARRCEPLQSMKENGIDCHNGGGEQRGSVRGGQGQ